MIAALKPYPAMKDSGVPWLGAVPGHWFTKPLKRWVRMNAEVLPETTAPDHGFYYLDIGSVGTGILTQNPQRLNFGAAPSRARRVVHAGDTVVSTVRTYLKAIYFVDEETDQLVCSTGFAVLTPRAGTLPKFVSYLIQSSSFTDQITADSVGIAYPAIAETRLGSFHVAVPPLPEQAAIVRFLDHADRRIRRYIRAKQKLIKLLDEQKQVIIHRAVTRGLDPSVRLKPSGVEWLGDVPEHWEVLRSKCVFREVDERSITGKEPRLAMSQKVGLVPSGGIEERRPVSESYSGAKLCQSGDLVLNRLKAHLGVFAVAAEPGLVSPDYTILRAWRGIAPRYFEAVYRSSACRMELRRRAKGIVEGFWRLYTDDFYMIRVPMPPPSEQLSIMFKLDSEIKSVNFAHIRTGREITLLCEYRTRLIADVVTGKLDVREAAARLPDEAEEPEAMDDANARAEGDEAGEDAGFDAATGEAEA